MRRGRNTPETAREDAGDEDDLPLRATPPLPTYLVAFAVGELEIKELARSDQAADPARSPRRARARTGRARRSRRRAGSSTRSRAWFGIPYPYDKLDIVAVPDFDAGAMENAGLITFREELLLLDPARASVRRARSQALVIAHELAHQWFGDLVTRRGGTTSG